MDKRPCAHIYETPRTPHAPSLREVPPEAALITEHVLAWLLIIIQCFIVARCARVRRREELVNRVAVCSFGARQREGSAEEGAKARWAVQIDPRLCVVKLVSAASRSRTREGNYGSATRSHRFRMREAKNAAQKSGEAHDVVRFDAIQSTVRTRSNGTRQMDSRCMWVMNILFTLDTWKDLLPSGWSEN